MRRKGPCDKGSFFFLWIFFHNSNVPCPILGLDPYGVLNQKQTHKSQTHLANNVPLNYISYPIAT
jgi:hypothetical protein